MAQKINREEMLRAFQSVSPGLTTKEILQQSSCLVFRRDRVHTFNDEIACSVPSPISDFEGAVPAKPFIAVLSKLPDELLQVTTNAEKVEVAGKGRKLKVNREAEILLPIDDLEQPDEWSQLPANFFEAVSLVGTCASKDESEFQLTCVHIGESVIEATDRYQIGRYEIECGFEKDICVRADSLDKASGFGMVQYCITDNWIHFRNEADLVFSCRTWVDDYEDLAQYLEFERDTPVVLPNGLDEVLARAEIFSADNVRSKNVGVSLQSGAVIFKGEGAYGEYMERRPISYDGDSLQFTIAPKLLLAVTEKASECYVDGSKLSVDAGAFLYLASLEAVEEEEN